MGRQPVLVVGSTGRRTRRRIPMAPLLAAAALTSLLASACGSTADSGPEVAARVAADHPVALVAEADGSLLYAERLTGDVRRLAPDGTLDPAPVAHVDTAGSEADQRGLIGLLRLPSGALLATWVRPDDDRVVVGRVDGPAPVVVWEGPPASDLANGGTLALASDGRVLVGIGDLQQDRSLADDPDVPNRKVLALDPAGPADQVPEALSAGWNNPFALVVDGDGVPWVADNSPGDQPERIGRADRPAAEAAALDTAEEGEAAPSALVDLGDGRLGRCGYLTGRLDEVDVRGEAPRLTGTVRAEPCRTGAARLADGRLATATGDELVLFD